MGLPYYPSCAKSDWEHPWEPGLWCKHQHSSPLSVTTPYSQRSVRPIFMLLKPPPAYKSDLSKMRSHDAIPPPKPLPWLPSVFRLQSQLHIPVLRVLLEERGQFTRVLAFPLILTPMCSFYACHPGLTTCCSIDMDPLSFLQAFASAVPSTWKALPTRPHPSLAQCQVLSPAPQGLSAAEPGSLSGPGRGTLW